MNKSYCCEDHANFGQLLLIAFGGLFFGMAAYFGLLFLAFGA